MLKNLIFSCALLSLPAVAFSATPDIVINNGNAVTKSKISTVTITKKAPTKKTERKAYKKPSLGYVTKDVPAVLSRSDVKLYKKMFRKQRARSRSEVAAMVPKLENRILMGHLIAERLLHPSTRSSYADLQKWLAKYSEQGPSVNVYKLANKRKPRKNRVGHKKPEVLQASLARYNNPNEKYENTRSAKKSRERSKLLRKLKHYRTKQYYTKSAGILTKKSTVKLIGMETWHSATTKLARAMVNDGYYSKAERLMRHVVSKSQTPHPESLWLAGFAAYNLDKYETAATSFRKLAYSVPKNSKYFAKAAWWTAKSYEKLDRASMGKVFYNMASQDQLSFYGQLAVEKTKKIKHGTWAEPKIKLKDKKFLFNNKTIKRVIALVQIGEYGLAQQELKMVYDNIPYDMDESLLALSMQLQLPNTSLTLAHNLKERNKIFLSGLYPNSKVWAPRGGYRIDKALINAVVKQESAFNPNIISRAGARGLMQIMPATAKYIRKNQKKYAYSKHSLLKPSVSLSLGQTYVSYLDTKLEGNLVQMIAAYNAGPGNVRKWLEADMGNGDPLLFIESIPFKETRKYVKRVMGNLWMYRERFNQPAPGLVAMANNLWPIKVASLGSKQASLFER